MSRMMKMKRGVGLGAKKEDSYPLKINRGGGW